MLARIRPHATGTGTLPRRLRDIAQSAGNRPEVSGGGRKEFFISRSRAIASTPSFAPVARSTASSSTRMKGLCWSSCAICDPSHERAERRGARTALLREGGGFHLPTSKQTDE